MINEIPEKDYHTILQTIFSIMEISENTKKPVEQLIRDVNDIVLNSSDAEGINKLIYLQFSTLGIYFYSLIVNSLSETIKENTSYLMN